MKQYLSLLQEVLDNGSQQGNRTGIDTIRLPYGTSRVYDLAEGFPLVTTKQMAFKGMKGELIAFLRACESAADFRALGCLFWDKNANEHGVDAEGNFVENKWLSNSHRKGQDDLGRIYGTQWRRWLGPLDYRNDDHEPASTKSPFRVNAKDGQQLGVYAEPLDQIMEALYLIHKNPTDRGIIINAWRPDEFKQMALRPCHVLYQFTVDVNAREISLCMYQRSADMFLGVPMNIASSALLLSIFGHLTGYKPRYFTHFIDDAHIYVNHLDQVKEQLTRSPHPLPRISFSERIPAFEGGLFKPHLIDMIGPEDILLHDYEHDEAIKGQMAV